MSGESELQDGAPSSRALPAIKGTIGGIGMSMSISSTTLTVVGNVDQSL